MHTTYEPAPPPEPLPRVARAMVAGLRRVRAHPVLNPTAFEESWRERAGHAVDPDHRPHLVAALEWLAHAQDATGQGGFARGYSLGWNPFFAGRAAWFLLATLGEDGVWLVASQEAPWPSALCNARTAWALAEAGRCLRAPEFSAAAAKAFQAVARRQHDDGWLPDCCFGDPLRPLLHSVAAAIGGLLEGGRVLGDEDLITRAASAAARGASAVDPAGRLPGRLAMGWRPAASWDSLAGV